VPTETELFADWFTSFQDPGDTLVRHFTALANETLMSGGMEAYLEMACVQKTQFTCSDTATMQLAATIYFIHGDALHDRCIVPDAPFIETMYEKSQNRANSLGAPHWRRSM
jgi:hypothetical protein